MGPGINEESLVTVGQVVNTHGHKGEVRVWPLTDFLDRFKEKTSFIFDLNGKIRTLTVDQARIHKNMVVIRFTEIMDMSSAEELKGGYLKVTKSELAELPQDAFFIFEIVGMDVETVGGEMLGKVKDVLQAGAGDLYLVSGQEKDYMIPAVKDIVLRIDRENRLITVNPPEGLLDLYVIKC